MTAPLSDAIAAMAQVIDAQARHIAKLEAGHWSQETRAEVTAARTILDQITDPDKPNHLHHQPLTEPWPKPGEHHNHPDDGTKEPECRKCQDDEGGMIALMALHGQSPQAADMFRRKLATGDPFSKADVPGGQPPVPDHQQTMIEDCSAARQVPPSMRAPLPGEPSMFDAGGYLPRGLTQVTNTTGKPKYIEAPPPKRWELGDGRPCQGRRTDDNARCVLISGHQWPHRWPDQPCSNPGCALGFAHNGPCAE